MSAGHIPEGFHTVVPNIIVESVDKAVAFYKKAFGAEEVLRLTMPDNKVVHCELRFGDSRVNLGEAMEGWPTHPLLAQIFVPDSDATFKRAIEAGAKELSPMTDMFFGFREGRVQDPAPPRRFVPVKSRRSELMSFCRGLPHATEDIKWGQEVVFSIGGKMFAGFMKDATEATFRCKADKDDFHAITQVEGIKPSPCAARFYWIAVEDPEALPQPEAIALLQRAYDIVRSNLPLKAQRELDGPAAPARKKSPPAAKGVSSKKTARKDD
jgi:PhnB protein